MEEEGYVVVEFTDADFLWYEYYEPFKEMVSILVEAAKFLLQDPFI